MLTINRDPHRSRYTCISNAALNDKRLSLAARGFLAVLLSLSDNWYFTIRGIAELTGVSIPAVRRHLTELQKSGYLKIAKASGSAKNYILNETPCEQNVTEQNVPEQNVPEQNVPEQNVPQLNNKITNNKITNTRERGKEDITSDTCEEKNCAVPPSLQTFADNSVISCDQQKEDTSCGNEAELPQLSCDQQKEELPQLILAAAGQGRPLLASATREDIRAAQRACTALGGCDDSIFLDRLEHNILRRKQLTELKRRQERS